MLRQQYFFNRYSYDEMIFLCCFDFPGQKWLALESLDTVDMEKQSATGGVDGSWKN
jgi:hypothetical protein